MTTNGLAAALVAFQAEVPTIPKNKTARIPTKTGGSYSYRYADLADIWEAIRPSLRKHGLAVTQMLVGGSNGWTGIETTIWHTSGDRESATVELQTGGRSPQEIGSAITYFKRYALSAGLGIATDEDTDAVGVEAYEQPRQQQRRQSSRAEADQAHAQAEESQASLSDQRKAFMEAQKARAALLARLKPYGWNEDNLTKRFKDDYGMDLLTYHNAEAITVFGEALEAEAMAQDLSEGKEPVAGIEQPDD